MGMKIIRYISSDMGANMYIITDRSHAVIIDPSRDDEALAQVATTNCSVDWILLTHEHCDHTAGAQCMRERFGASVVCSRACRDNLQDPRINYSHYFNALAQVQTKLCNHGTQLMNEFVLEPDWVFCGEATLPFQGHTLHLLEAPGHSTGSILIRLDENTLFSGDSLLPDDLTVTRFITGSKHALQTITIPLLQSLPRSMIVYPGHMEAFRLGERLKKPII